MEKRGLILLFIFAVTMLGFLAIEWTGKVVYVTDEGLSVSQQFPGYPSSPPVEAGDFNLTQVEDDPSEILASNVTCGDNVCEGAENATGCPQDCGEPINLICGNRVCEPHLGEDASSCPTDCVLTNETDQQIENETRADETEKAGETEGETKPEQQSKGIEEYEGESYKICTSSGNIAIIFGAKPSGYIEPQTSEDCRRGQFSPTMGENVVGARLQISLMSILKRMFGLP